MDLATTAQTLTDGINQFSTHFYKETAAENLNKNLIMSPLSAQLILALLSLGSRGVTQKELNAALYLPDEEFIKSAFEPAIKDLQATRGVIIKIANKIYVKEGERFALRSEFKRLAAEIFSAEAQNVDFEQAEEAAKTINTWVETKTNNKIKNLILSKSLDVTTRIVLVNAIYFQGNWAKVFKVENTEEKDFYLNKNDKVKVQMMKQTSNFFYSEVPEWDAKVIELMYAGGQMTMVVILPNEIDGLKAVEDKIATGALNLTTVTKNTKSVKVNLSLPKFKIETSIDLKKILPKLGMQRILSGDADLSGLLETEEPLVISEAIQKAFIEVNEKGSEAAASTAIFAVGSSGPSFQKEIFDFHADHPFLFYIRTFTDNVFCGRFIGNNL